MGALLTVVVEMVRSHWCNVGMLSRQRWRTIDCVSEACQCFWRDVSQSCGSEPGGIMGNHPAVSPAGSPVAFSGAEVWSLILLLPRWCLSHLKETKAGLGLFWVKRCSQESGVAKNKTDSSEMKNRAKEELKWPSSNLESRKFQTQKHTTISSFSALVWIGVVSEFQSV